MLRRNVPRFRFATVVATVLAVSGCVGSGSGEEPGTQLTRVTVGVNPIADVAPLYLGMRKGFFSARGLEITPIPAQGGPTIVPAVVSGKNEIGFSNVVSLLTARERGLPLVSIVGGSSSTGRSGADVQAVLVGKNSTLRRPRDLTGKRVAVNSLKTIGDTTIRAAVERDGGDPDAVRFIELGFADMPAQLEKGTVDAVWEAEPFRSQIITAGGRVLFNNLTAMYPKLQIAQYFTAESYLRKRPEVVNAFVAGLTESFAYAGRHPDEVRAILSTYTKLTPEKARTIVLPGWATELDRGSAAALGSAARKYGTLKREPDVDGLFGSVD